MRALVIDDSRTVRIIIGKYLKEIGVDVEEAANGREALERLRQLPGIAIALIDWNMPEMNGLDFVRAVRSDAALKDIILMMVTTETEREQVVRALEAGANEYVMKPFTKDVLLTKLRMLGFLRD